MTINAKRSLRSVSEMMRVAGIKIILGAFVVLAVIYSVATPAFETPDEMAHFAYIRGLVDGRGFPAAPIVVADDQPAQESSQPPLYYVSAALAVRLIAPDTSDLAEWIVRNPAFPYIFGNTYNDNKNLAIHALPDIFPYRGASRALHVARLVTVLFGALAVWATYRLGREAFPGNPAVGLVAAAVVAFLPQFVFISGAVSNDPAATALCALSLWGVVRGIRRGFTWRRAAALGAALSLAALSKASAVALVPLAILAVIFVSADRQSRLKTRAGWSLLVLGVVLLLIGPWYARTWLVFGDPLGTSTHLAMPWARPAPLAIGEAASKLPYALISFWIAFGWGNIVTPDWVYTVLNVAGAIGLIGVGLWSVKPERYAPAIDRASALYVERSIVALLVVWGLVIIAALVRWIQLLDAAIGRLAFPALAGFAVLFALGWLRILRRRWLVAVIPMILLALTVTAIPAVLLPAYAQPLILSEQAIAQQPGHPIDVRFGDVARLIRLDVPRDHWPQPGAGFDLLLCWEPLARDERMLMVLVQIIGENNRLLSSRRTLPGLGSYPTGIWQPGGRFCDPVHVQLDDKTPAPAVYRVEVGMIDHIDQDTEERLPAYAPDGSQLSTNFVDAIKVAPREYVSPPIENALSYRLGDQIELIGYAVEPAAVDRSGTARLRLYWRALRRPDKDYTVFVHVQDAEQHLLTQADGPPKSGAYPTSFWDAGEVVSDDREIAIPAAAPSGHYSIVLGLYQAPDGARLSLANDAAQTEIVLPIGLEVR